MKHLDLFSGIGGFALAASWVWGQDHELVAFCEQNDFCQRVLSKNWPGIPIHTDIKKFRQQTRISMHKGYDYGPIDLVSGGFPCQPYSTAGLQRGEEDDRALWPEMLRVIKETRPRWFVGENVTGFVNMGLEGALSDLEGEGYETLPPFIIPACAVQACHRRDRVWIVAHHEGGTDWQNFQESIERQKQELGKGSGGNFVSHSPMWGWDESPATSAGKYQRSPWQAGGCHCNDLIPHAGHGSRESRRSTLRLGRPPESIQEHRDWLKISESPICEANDGVPNRVEQINGYGNAIVPQVVMVIMACIKAIEESI